MATFSHHDLALLNPAFDSPLVDVLTELEHLRRLQLTGTTPAPLFFQLKRIFHMLESLGSARIEGNHTTLADYVETALESSGDRASTSDQVHEVSNIEAAMAYVDEQVKEGSAISEHFVRELHAQTVQGLQREGDATPGAYRRTQVQIAQALHLPPDALRVPDYMQELVAFINRADAPKYDLIKVALAHHRFAWIHPFGNGNGRVVRLLTYALLVKYGFNVQTGGRVLNPTAIFCSDRERYYTMLATADSGQAADLESWCVYVLDGMLAELRKVDRLTRYDYLSEKILQPALLHAQNRGLVTPQEFGILLVAAKQGTVKAADLASAMPALSDTQRGYQIRKLVEIGMLRPIAVKARQYTIGFESNSLMRGVIHALTQEEFISAPLRGG